MKKFFKQPNIVLIFTSAFLVVIIIGFSYFYKFVNSRDITEFFIRRVTNLLRTKNIKFNFEKYEGGIFAGLTVYKLSLNTDLIKVTIPKLYLTASMKSFVKYNLKIKIPVLHFKVKYKKNKVPIYKKIAVIMEILENIKKKNLSFKIYSLIDVLVKKIECQKSLIYIGSNKYKGDFVYITDKNVSNFKINLGEDSYFYISREDSLIKTEFDNFTIYLPVPYFKNHWITLKGKAVFQKEKLFFDAIKIKFKGKPWALKIEGTIHKELSSIVCTLFRWPGVPVYFKDLKINDVSNLDIKLNIKGSFQKPEYDLIFKLKQGKGKFVYHNIPFRIEKCNLDGSIRKGKLSMSINLWQSFEKDVKVVELNKSAIDFDLVQNEFLRLNIKGVLYKSKILESILKKFRFPLKIFKNIDFILNKDKNQFGFTFKTDKLKIKNIKLNKCLVCGKVYKDKLKITKGSAEFKNMLFDFKGCFKFLPFLYTQLEYLSKAVSFSQLGINLSPFTKILGKVKIKGSMIYKRGKVFYKNKILFQDNILEYSRIPLRISDISGELDVFKGYSVADKVSLKVFKVPFVVSGKIFKNRFNFQVKAFKRVLLKDIIRVFMKDKYIELPVENSYALKGTVSKNEDSLNLDLIFTGENSEKIRLLNDKQGIIIKFEKFKPTVKLGDGRFVIPVVSGKLSLANNTSISGLFQLEEGGVVFINSEKDRLVLKSGEIPVQYILNYNHLKNTEVSGKAVLTGVVQNGAFSGKLHIRDEGSGKLNIKMKLPRVKWLSDLTKNIPFKFIHLEFVLDKTGIEIKVAKLKGQRLNFVAKGRIEFDSSIRLSVTTVIGSRAAEKLKVGSGKELLRDRKGRLGLSFSIVGTVFEPELKINLRKQVFKNITKNPASLVKFLLEF